VSWPIQDGVFELGDLDVERGGVIRDARLVWQAHGTLNAAKDNVIVYPCSYTATHEGLTWLIGPDQILDPTRWFIVIPDMFSNGLSSGAAESADAGITDFPSVVTMADNVRAQHRLLTEHFGIARVAASYGFSMGAGQAYHWAALFPDLVERAIVVCGSAKTSVHNRVFLSGLLRTLEAAPEYLGGGQFSAEPVNTLRAFGHIYAGWGLSQDFYREGLYHTALGAPDLETFLRTDWEASFGAHRAANLYAQAVTWQEADISATYGGDLPKALAAIEARVLLVPSETDLYFRVADNDAELPYLAHGALRPIPSIWGHRAGSPQGIPADLAFLKTAVGEWLASTGPAH
jgi:homoserine O-acetyltransferase/O-succinyltransferase